MYSQNQQKPPSLIVKEPTVKGIPVQWKFFRKMASADKARGIEEYVIAMDMPQKGNTIVKSNIDPKMTREANARMGLKVHGVSTTDSDQGFFTFVYKPPFNLKSHLPLMYYVNAVLFILWFVVVFIFALNLNRI